MNSFHRLSFTSGKRRLVPVPKPMYFYVFSYKVAQLQQGWSGGAHFRAVCELVAMALFQLKEDTDKKSVKAEGDPEVHRFFTLCMLCSTYQVLT